MKKQLPRITGKQKLVSANRIGKYSYDKLRKKYVEEIHYISDKYSVTANDMIDIHLEIFGNYQITLLNSLKEICLGQKVNFDMAAFLEYNKQKLDEMFCNIQQQEKTQ